MPYPQLLTMGTWTITFVNLAIIIQVVLCVPTPPNTGRRQNDVTSTANLYKDEIHTTDTNTNEKQMLGLQGNDLNQKFFKKMDEHHLPQPSTTQKENYTSYQKERKITSLQKSFDESSQQDRPILSGAGHLLTNEIMKNPETIGLKPTPSELRNKFEEIKQKPREFNDKPNSQSLENTMKNINTNLDADVGKSPKAKVLRNPSEKMLLFSPTNGKPLNSEVQDTGNDKPPSKGFFIRIEKLPSEDDGDDEPCDCVDGCQPAEGIEKKTEVSGPKITSEGMDSLQDESCDCEDEGSEPVKIIPDKIPKSEGNDKMLYQFNKNDFSQFSNTQNVKPIAQFNGELHPLIHLVLTIRKQAMANAKHEEHSKPKINSLEDNFIGRTPFSYDSLSQVAQRETIQNPLPFANILFKISQAAKPNMDSSPDDPPCDMDNEQSNSDVSEHNLDKSSVFSSMINDMPELKKTLSRDVFLNTDSNKKNPRQNFKHIFLFKITKKNYKSEESDPSKYQKLQSEERNYRQETPQLNPKLLFVSPNVPQLPPLRFPEENSGYKFRNFEPAVLNKFASFGKLPTQRKTYGNDWSMDESSETKEREVEGLEKPRTEDPEQFLNLIKNVLLNINSQKFPGIQALPTEDLMNQFRNE